MDKRESLINILPIGLVDGPWSYFNAFLVFIFFLGFAFFWYLLSSKIVDFLRTRGIARRNFIWDIALPFFRYGGSLFLLMSGLSLSAEFSMGMAVFLSVSIVGLVLFSLVGPVRSVMASLFLSMQANLKTGDVVKAAGYQGKVQRLDWLRILLITDTGDIVSLPTNRLLKEGYSLISPKRGYQLEEVFSSKKYNKDKLLLSLGMCPFRKPQTQIHIEDEENKTVVRIQLKSEDYSEPAKNYVKQSIKEASL